MYRLSLLLRRMSDGNRDSEEDRAKNYYKKLLETSGKAEDCVQCGQCESVCPQHLPIIDLLKEASEKLDVPVTE
mgnify:CR=1 FL=1